MVLSIYSQFDLKLSWFIILTAFYFDYWSPNDFVEDYR